MGRLDIEQSSSRGRAGRRKEGKGSTIAIKKEQMKSWNYNQMISSVKKSSVIE